MACSPVPAGPEPVQDAAAVDSGAVNEPADAADGTDLTDAAGSIIEVDASDADAAALARLVVAVEGAGLVRGPGIECGDECTEDVVLGTTVMFEATATEGWDLREWTGACTGTDRTCTVQVAGDATIGAIFAQRFRTLTVTAQGSGRVTSRDGSIDCPTRCSATYPEGAPVVLVATAAAGWHVGGWSGACTGTGACEMVMLTDRTAAATFAQTLHRLTVRKAGTGDGTVAATSGATLSLPVGTPTATIEVAEGTIVVLSAAGAGDSDFTGWAGPCMGAGECHVTVGAATDVTASFYIARATLTITNRQDVDPFLITSRPAGIRCRDTSRTGCSAVFPVGMPITLEAAGDFTTCRWVGAPRCPDGSRSCTVTLGGNLSIQFQTVF
jgi:hypothetical protein